MPELDSGENLLKLQDCTEECLKSRLDNMQCFLISFGEILSVCNGKELETVKKNFVRILQILVDPSDIISRETVLQCAFDILDLTVIRRMKDSWIVNLNNIYSCFFMNENNEVLTNDSMFKIITKYMCQTSNVMSITAGVEILLQSHMMLKNFEQLVHRRIYQIIDSLRSRCEENCEPQNFHKLIIQSVSQIISEISKNEKIQILDVSRKFYKAEDPSGRRSPRPKIPQAEDPSG